MLIDRDRSVGNGSGARSFTSMTGDVGWRDIHVYGQFGNGVVWKWGRCAVKSSLNHIDCLTSAYFTIPSLVRGDDGMGRNSVKENADAIVMKADRPSFIEIPNWAPSRRDSANRSFLGRFFAPHWPPRAVILKAPGSNGSPEDGCGYQCADPIIELRFECGDGWVDAIVRRLVSLLLRDISDRHGNVELCYAP